MKNIKLINGHPFVAYSKETYTEGEMETKAADFLKWMEKRRTCRDFSAAENPCEDDSE